LRDTTRAELRSGTGYSIAEAADKAGISESLLEAIEDGQYENVGLVVLDKLCSLYGISVRDLVGSEVAAPRSARDVNLRRLESVAAKVGWSAADFIALRDSYESEVAASGGSVTVSEEEWMARHQAVERQKMNLTANVTPADQKHFDFTHGRER